MENQKIITSGKNESKKKKKRRKRPSKKG